MSLYGNFWYQNQKVLRNDARQKLNPSARNEALEKFAKVSVAPQASISKRRKACGRLRETVSNAAVLMYAALEASASSAAPGHDEVHLEDLSLHDLWKHCHSLSDDLKQGTFTWSETRPATIRKDDGSRREIQIQCAQDRIVSRAIKLILDRALDSCFADHSYGFRPGRGALDALLRLERHVQSGRTQVIPTDIRNAFGVIPRVQLWQALSHFGFDDHAKELLVPLSSSSSKGIPQGVAFSPNLMNIFLHQYLDSWLQREGVQAIRYADDIVPVADASETVADWHRAMSIRLRDVGMPLKETGDQAIDLRSASVQWLGYKIDAPDGRVRYRLRDGIFEGLKDSLRMCWQKPHSSQLARQVMTGFVGHLGPCFEAHESALDSVEVCARDEGFTEAFQRQQLRDHWEQANERYAQRREKYFAQGISPVLAAAT